MARVTLLLVMMVALCAAPGCFTMEAEHNRGHWEIIRTDIREWHSDMDFILGLDEPTLLETHYR